RRNRRRHRRANLHRQEPHPARTNQGRAGLAACPQSAMNPCNPELLPLSAAGLLDAAGEALLRRHVLECPHCAAQLESFAEIPAGLASLPAPAPPPDLIAAVHLRLAADRDRRQAWRLSLAASACATSLTAAACFALQPDLGPLVWVAGLVVPGVLGAIAAL